LSCSEKVYTDNNYCSYCRNKKIAFCISCGKEKEKPNAKYCNNCRIDVTRIGNKYRNQKWIEKKKFKYVESSICDYDCFNCKYGDCIQPMDKDDSMQGALFTD